MVGWFIFFFLPVAFFFAYFLFVCVRVVGLFVCQLFISILSSLFVVLFCLFASCLFVNLLVYFLFSLFLTKPQVI